MSLWFPVMCVFLRESVEAVGRAPCPLNIRELLKEKAVAAFGKSNTWTEAQVNIMGNIIGELQRTPSDKLEYLHVTSSSLKCESWLCHFMCF